ncbi:MAG: hypothetical protein GF330_02285 [Candidatus Eisenbacteria bacterium]|nr:hypothetical protein [Candidatus Eisenbacteria bacterium]
MRNVYLGIGLLVLLAGSAAADPEDLSSGVFICHHDPDISYSPPPYPICETYLEGYAIEDPMAQNPSIMTTDGRMWFILAAFEEEKRWCGTEFGFGDYDPYLFIFFNAAACAAGSFLEIPTDGWPGPNEGVAIVTTDEPWFGHLEPVYYFEGYAYYGLSGIIPVDVDPPTGFAGWGNCLTPPESYATQCFPGMGILTEGIYCGPVAPPGACCIGEDCFTVLEEECAAMGGDWYPDHDCGPSNPCLPQAACCVCQDCSITNEPTCDDLGGEWHPEWSECEPNPCPASPAREASWGTIKSIYR